jgi:uncharacterized protein (DUF2267 family)
MEVTIQRDVSAKQQSVHPQQQRQTQMEVAKHIQTVNEPVQIQAQIQAQKRVRVELSTMQDMLSQVYSYLKQNGLLRMLITTLGQS